MQAAAHRQARNAWPIAEVAIEELLQMLAKDLSDKEIGRIIRFSGGNNYSNPDYEFRATYLGIKNYQVSVNTDLEFEEYINDLLAQKGINQLGAYRPK